MSITTLTVCLLLLWEVDLEGSGGVGELGRGNEGGESCYKDQFGYFVGVKWII
jgi:hypothetical protein